MHTHSLLPILARLCGPAHPMFLEHAQHASLGRLKQGGRSSTSSCHSKLNLWLEFRVA